MSAEARLPGRAVYCYVARCGGAFAWFYWLCCSEDGEAYLLKTHVHGNGFRFTIPKIEVMDIVMDRDLIIPET